MIEIVAGDIGGTNARFARAFLEPGKRPRLGDVRTYRAASLPDLAAGWARFLEDEPEASPTGAGIAVAAPIDGGLIRFTNSPWIIDPATIADQIGLGDVLLLNDFGAMAHAVAWLTDDELAHIAGPAQPAHPEGVTTVIGPGTGLGVAILLRRHGTFEVIETEGGHFDFGPVDPLEERILHRLRDKFGRASTERLISGPGLANIHESLAAIEAKPVVPRDDAALWASAIDGSDALAKAALDRFVMTFGSVTGDLTLAHGANQVILIGGLSNRIRDRLQSGPFHARFCAKGRYAPRMARFPIRLVLHEQPGLLGAAAAFAHRGKSA